MKYMKKKKLHIKQYFLFLDNIKFIQLGEDELVREKCNRARCCLGVRQKGWAVLNSRAEDG